MGIYPKKDLIDGIPGSDTLKAIANFNKPTPKPVNVGLIQAKIQNGSKLSFSNFTGFYQKVGEYPLCEGG